MANKSLIFTILGVDEASKAFKEVSKSVDETGERLKSFSAVGTKVLAGFPAVALAAGAATAGALTLVGAGVAGAAAVILRNNEQIAASGSNLANNFHTSMQAAAAPLATSFTAALNTVNHAITDLAPQLNNLFAASAPAIQHLTDGVVLFARGAMPGLVTAVRSSEPALQGIQNLMESTGKGVTLFFTNLSKGAQSSGQIMTSAGHIISDFLGFAGSLFAQLSNSGAPAVHALEGFLSQLETTILSLAHGAFPALAAGAAGFISVGSGILTVFNALAPILGPIIGQLGSFAVALKLVDTVSFGQVSTAFTALKSAVGEADGVVGKFKAGISSLGSSGIVPLGIAAAGLSLILGGLGDEQQKAAQAAAQHETRVQNLTDALRQSKGAIDDNVRSLAAKTLSETKVGDSGKTVLEIARESGVSLSQLTDAYLGNADAVAGVNGALDAYIKLQNQGREYDQLGATTETPESIHARELKDLLPGLNSEYATSAQRAKDLAEATGTSAKATGDLTGKIEGAKKATSQWEKDFLTLSDSMAKVSEKGSAVIDILDQMTGKQPDLRVTQQAWDDLMRSITKDTDWDTAKDGVQKLSKGLVDARGEINTTTEAGSKLLGFAQSAQTAFADSAAAMRAAHVPADQMTQKLEAMRKAFVDNAVAQGLPRDAAIRLADAYHLVPNDVVTAFVSPGLLQRIQELGILNYQIVHLPNGQFEVVANTDPARGSLTKLIETYDGRVITLKIVGVGANQTVRNAAGGLPALAAGGWVKGPGTTTSDSVPTLLSNKEFVVPADRAAKYASTLEAIRDGRDPLLSLSTNVGVKPAPFAGPRERRALVSIGTMHVSPNQSPHEIATDLDWMSRGGGY